MTTPSSPQQPNTLGNASLALGIVPMALVFGIGLCALTCLDATVRGPRPSSACSSASAASACSWPS